jgi:pimeloyl-ACP methyl ester carboxylesterase/glyoxylase-like metal-dependent hydrolase (beta-lactamase superfamily II)
MTPFNAMLFAICAIAAGQTLTPDNQPIEPFKIADNVYYVGSSDIASYLIRTRDGAIVIDGGYAETAPMIEANARKIGIDPHDIKILLNTQAHFDHAGGFAALKRATGAKLFASAADAEVIEHGGHGDFYFGDNGPFSAATVDRVLKDGDQVKLGEATLTAHLTPGHTKGCTTWTWDAHDRGRTYHVVDLCGLSILQGTDVNGMPAYPNIRQDYEHTYDVLKSLPCDIFLGAHASYYGGREKAARLRTQPDDPNPFVDPNGYHAFIESAEKHFRDLLARAPEIVSFPSGALTLRGVLYRPSGAGPFRAILYNHGSAKDSSPAAEALGPFFASRGWAFFFPYRRGQGLSESAGPYSQDEIAAANRRGGIRAAAETLVRLMQTDHLNDQLAALAWLRAQPFVKADRVVVMGNSFGGIQTVLGAAPGSYCAGVATAAGAQSWAQAPELQDVMIKAAEQTRIPMFFFQAANDYDLAPSRTLFAAMQKNGNTAEMKIYPAFGKSTADGHTFAYFGSAVWADDVFKFLDRYCAADWKDPSPHVTRFVTASDAVRLEVLDWGGSGRPLMLLAGGGDTAHVFDDFAPKLTRDFHVYGMTRRGFGASGYAKPSGSDTYGDDVLAVMDALKLDKPVLVAHSVGGQELSSIAARYPARVSALVYLDAAYPYAFDNGHGPAMKDFQDQRSPQPPPPSQSDLASFPALREYYRRVLGFTYPEAELRQQRPVNANGLIGEPRDFVGYSTLLADVKKYADIPVPALVVFGLPHGLGPWVDSSTPAVRQRVEAYTARLTVVTERQAKIIADNVATARVVRLAGAHHYVFLSNEADVLREMRAFLRGRPPN